MKFCEKCQKEYPETAMFCEICGQPLTVQEEDGPEKGTTEAL